MPKLCSVQGCGGNGKLVKGLCKPHYDAAWRLANPEKVLARKAKWRKANSEKIRLADREARANNGEKFRTAQKNRRAADPEKYRAQKRADYQRHKAARRKAVADWQAANREWTRGYYRKLRADISDSYIKDLYVLPKDVPEVVIETYRVILQIKRELRS